MDCVRKLTREDFTLIRLWWLSKGVVLDMEAVYPLATSYVYEREGVPVYAVALQCLTGLPRAYVEGFIRNPSLPTDRNAVLKLQEHLDKEAKALGISALYAVTKDAAVHEIHTQLGYRPTQLMLYNSIRRL